jgi:hypothetical protein
MPHPLSPSPAPARASFATACASTAALAATTLRTAAALHVSRLLAGRGDANSIVAMTVH